MRRSLPEHVCGEQVCLALVHVHTVLASQHATPLIWTRRDGYRLAPDLPELIDHERAQFRMELTRLDNC